MKHAIIRALTVSTLVVSSLCAHDIITTNLTYTRDVSRILAHRCAECHAQSSSIPLTNYEEVRPWAVDIKDQVLSRAMPPWGAVKGFGDLSPDHALTQEEILILAAWVVGGAPKGDLALLPKLQPSTISVNPVLKDALFVRSRATLTEPLRLAGIRPVVTNLVESARVTARLPDGRIEPLVWLYRFDPKTQITFHFRQPLALPPGTVVESSTPLRFALEIPSSRRTGRSSALLTTLGPSSDGETGSVGRSSASHASNPPSNGRTLRTPACLNCRATRALVASFGQVQ